MKHFSVLLNEVINGLDIKEEGIYVDGTLGRAGHSSEILRKIRTGHLYCFDQDIQAITESKERLSRISSNFTLINDNFSNLKIRLNELGVDKVDGILLDIGVSSPQFDDQERGFSYRFDARLDMRMNQQQELDAHYIVNNYDVSELIRILREYGEEKYAKQIAFSITKNRPIDTTFDLVEAIKKALPAKVLNKKGHPAKQTFQALRIEVNNELEVLKEVIEQGLNLLAVEGRLAIITFHSLEDRIVKQKFNSVSEIKIDKRLIIKEIDYPQADFKQVNKKPILAGEEELEVNHRSTSAKLRIIKRVKE